MKRFLVLLSLLGCLIATNVFAQAACTMSRNEATLTNAGDGINGFLLKGCDVFDGSAITATVQLTPSKCKGHIWMELTGAETGQVYAIVPVTGVCNATAGIPNVKPGQIGYNTYFGYLTTIAHIEQPDFSYLVTFLFPDHMTLDNVEVEVTIQ